MKARTEARRRLSAVDLGADPVEDRRQHREAPTLADFADRYMEEHSRAKKKPSSIKTDERLLIRLLLLTGCRRGEIQKLTWDQVDLDRRRLMLSDSKTGFKVVPLATPAVALLAKAPRQKDNPYVCFGPRSPHITTVVDKYWKKIRRAAQLEDVRLHDIRHTFASFGVANQLGLPVVGRVLGHTTLQTTD